MANIVVNRLYAMVDIALIDNMPWLILYVINFMLAEIFFINDVMSWQISYF